MNLNSNETMFDSIKIINDNNYMVCYKTPPNIVSDGLWGGTENGRTPMKSFLPIFELQVLIIFVITQICRFFLKPLRLPLFISQMMAGIILHVCLLVEPLGTYTRKLFPYGTHATISTISSIGYILFIFTNGVQMDFSMITRMGKKVWTIAIIGLIVPLSIAFSTLALFHKQLREYIENYDDLYVVLVSHSTISFAVVASLLNELQIINSELGRLALSSALVSDVLCTVVTTIGTPIMMDPYSNSKVLIGKLLALLALLIFVPLVCRPTMFWIIKNTQEGRPVKDGYLYAIVLMVLALGWVSIKIDQQFVLGAFVMGLSVPEGPPLGSALVKKFEFFGNSFFLPIFITISMLKADFSMNHSSILVITTVFVIFATHFIKMISCFVPALFSNMPIRDALTLALILNCKGVVEIGLYYYLYDDQIIDGETYGIMMISIIIIASFVQWSVKVMYDPSRKYVGYQKRNIMSLRPNCELKILGCIHKPNHISSMIGMLNLCCPTTENPIIVEVLHLIELVGRALPLFVSHRFQRQEFGVNKSYSDKVILAFDLYEHDNPRAIVANTYTAISPTNLMYEDVCNLALDKVASIIILPFHQIWSIDGEVEDDDKNIRTLNFRVLEIAPCSVGILVNRASHRIIDSSTRLAMIYLGGQDDNEALCLAKRALMSGINLVVYHLVVEECVLDDCSGELLDDRAMLQDVKHAKNVWYQQIIAKEGSQTAGFLCDVVKKHDFFIVGRRHNINSAQTNGLTTWSEFPELGVIGDFLASPELRSHASILVVQQQLSPKSCTSHLF
ncbi:hypothetical protein RJT34_01137 [Clitoria ternatea]|uniref:Cation/H+ exchanger domain-containing protein n=1 Tax=Clitoria ternatea TaxID=43366 RepID=A0AAN9KJ20_CLITE